MRKLVTEVRSDEDKPKPKDFANSSAASLSYTGESSPLLQPLTAALLECVTPAEVVVVVVERGVAVLGARAGLVALVSSDGEALEVIRTSGYSDEVMEGWHRFPLAAHLPLSDAVRENTVLLFEGRADWQARYPDMVHQIPQGNYLASASLPLSARGRVFGALHFSFPKEQGFSAANQEFLADLARQCALTLDRALLLARSEAANRRLEFLTRASTLLAESLDYQTTLDAIARLAVPNLCDWAAVDVVDTTTEGGPLLNLAVAHADPAEVTWVREAQRRYPVDMTQAGQPVVQVISTGQTVFLPEIPEEALLAAARDAEHLQLIRKLNLRSYLCVPLIARGKTLGAITLATTRASGHAFVAETIALAEELARRAAVAMDNALLYAEAKHVHIEREQFVIQLQEANIRQRRFLKEMLAGFTEGRLRLCFSPDELPTPLEPLSDLLTLSEATLRRLRRAVEVAAAELKLPQERAEDAVTSSHEAAMNAVRHGRNGTARVYGDQETGAIQVWVQDYGPGITEEMIHRAVEQGFTTGGFGQGFYLMRSCADRLFLLTGPMGTTVVLEMDRTPPVPAWLSLSPA